MNRLFPGDGAGDLPALLEEGVQPLGREIAEFLTKPDLLGDDVGGVRLDREGADAQQMAP